MKLIEFKLVVLQAADSVLIERAAGKRIDPKTGGITFHLFNTLNLNFGST